MSGLEMFEKARLIIQTALDLKAEAPTVLDMREVSSFADTFIVLTGRSDRHVRSVADAIIAVLRDAQDPPLGVEGLGEGSWVLIDGNDAVVHIFEPETRLLFDLERLWSDAKRIDIAGDLGLKIGQDPQDDSFAGSISG